MALTTNRLLLIVSILFALLFGKTVHADEQKPVFIQSTEKRALAVHKLVSGLNHPWAIAFISNTDWLVTERSGQLRRVTNGKLLNQAISGLPTIKQNGQGGLLDVALHPDFENNQWVYLSYSGSVGAKSGTEVLRGTLIGNKLENTEVIFKALPKSRGGRHFGSRLTFDDQGFLYVSLGDRGDKNNGQRKNTHPGSVVRLNDNGSVPTSNPFVGVEGVLPEIYSYGHRNIQGMTFDPISKTLWAHEHGPQGGDELNRIIAGNNYGWPTITYGVNYGSGTKIGEGSEKTGMEQPLTYWDPSIAPSGLAVVNSNRYPEWRGNIFVGALKYQLLARLEMQDGKPINEERLLAGELGRIRDVRQGPDGYIYLLTDDRNGAIYRLE